ncbi:MAG TPA: M13 family metallopeptidase, partial [Candidatus Angelobacter sp.]|nr:M13 family metallopeptidase [Candidatus Angelobacter sp.]
MTAIAAALGQTTADSGKLPPLSHFDAGIVDHDISPCVDFYKFVCSKWQADNPIPADQVAWSTTSNLRLWNETILRNALQEAANPAPGRTPVQQKIGDYWYACMDETAIDKSGMAPIEPELNQIRAMKDKAQIAAVLAQVHMKMPGSWDGGNNETLAPLFGYSSTIDFDNSQLVVAGIDQGGFAMNGKDFYLSDNAHLVEVRGKYVEYLQTVFTLAGENEAKAKADAAVVMRIETAMAKAAMDAVSRRDPAKMNNVMNLQQVQALTPSFRWNDYLAAVKSPTPQHYIVTAPDFFRALETLLKSESLDDWKTYLSYWVIDRNAGYMSKAFQDANFDFWNKTMLGQKAALPRWRRCVRWADRDLGEALGQAYVAKAFPPESKARVEKMIDGIEVAMGQDIQQVDWMAAETKQKGQTKLKAVIDNIGYPDKWRDYSSVSIGRDSLVTNVQAAAVFEYQRQLDKIGHPVDRREWGMTPPTINAYENPQNNTINFPAGILQPPFFDAATD